jgi:hypothetical protein
MTPSAATLALMLPGGMAQAMGLRSLAQLAEPGPDPDSAGRLLAELLDAESDYPSHGRTEPEPC